MESRPDHLPTTPFCLSVYDCSWRSLSIKEVGQRKGHWRSDSGNNVK